MPESVGSQYSSFPEQLVDFFFVFLISKKVYNKTLNEEFKCCLYCRPHAKPTAISFHTFKLALFIQLHAENFSKDLHDGSVSVFLFLTKSSHIFVLLSVYSSLSYHSKPNQFSAC